MVVVSRPPKRTLSDNGCLLAHITNAALRPDTCIRRPLCSATEPHGTVQESIQGDTSMADVVPSEELRSFMLRLYSAWDTQEFEVQRDRNFSLSAAILTSGGCDPMSSKSGSGRPVRPEGFTSNQAGYGVLHGQRRVGDG